MKIVAEEKKIVMGLYFVTLLASLFSVLENIPLIGLLNKVKYLYIAVMAVILVYDGVLVWNKRFTIAMGLLVLHTILYGLVFVNPIIELYTHSQFQMLCDCYLMTIFTTLYIYKKKCYIEFVQNTYLALAIMMVWSAITHLGDFVNPIYFINIFSRTERFRADFGMKDVNYAGNYCLYVLIFALLLYIEWKKNKIAVNRQIWIAYWISNVISLAIIFSTASRSAVLSLALFLMVALLLRYKAMLLKNAKVILVVGGILLVFMLVVLVTTGAFSSIWSESNREGNISINLPIFHRHGNYLNGMGYMDNSGYLNKLYGYDTTAMDIYYLHIFFSTGILGSILVFGQMLYILYCLLRYSKTEGRTMALSLFVMMLFYAVWQVNYMNSRYWTGMLHMIVLFSFLLRINEEKDTYLIQIKRR